MKELSSGSKQTAQINTCPYDDIRSPISTSESPLLTCLGYVYHSSFVKPARNMWRHIFLIIGRQFLVRVCSSIVNRIGKMIQLNVASRIIFSPSQSVCFHSVCGCMEVELKASSIYYLSISMQKVWTSLCRAIVQRWVHCNRSTAIQRACYVARIGVWEVIRRSQRKTAIVLTC